MIALKQTESYIATKFTENIVEDAKLIIEASQKAAYSAVNLALLQRNWLLGKRIAQEELKGQNRAEYGALTIKTLSKELTAIYGKGFAPRVLYYCEQFYQAFPEILHSVSAKSLPLLSWTHYRILIQVADKTARDWYANEAAC